VNTHRCDDDRLELMELVIFFLPSDEKFGVEVSAVDLEVSAVRLILLLLVQMFIVFGLTNWCCSLNAVKSQKSINCLPNEEIFAELSRMGYEKPSNKLTFYKAFFSQQWKFLIHTILQCMSAKRTSWNEFSSSMDSAVICLSTVGDLSLHSIKYSSLALTQKVFANMRRVGKGFSGVDTPLFEGMLVAQQVDESAAEVNVDDVPAVGVTAEGAADVITDVVLTAADEPIKSSLTPTTLPPPPSQDGRQAESKAQIYQIDLEHVNKVLSMQDDEVKPAELQEVVEVVTTAKLIIKVVTAASATITAAALQFTIATASAARRRKGVVIRDLEETATQSIIIHSEAKSKDKGMKYDDIRLIFEKYFNSNVAFLEKTKEQMEEEDIRALKRLSESQEDKTAKKQKLDEEVEELKRNFQIVPNDEDDVYTEATSPARKVPVVDYTMHIENNKPYFKIIRADGTHQLFLSFLSLLRNFDREDLDVLWEFVKERFASSKPKNFSNDFLLTTLTYMFEKPDVQAQMILLVERRYLLTRFTLDQMLNNVRLEVEGKSEVSLELLKFVRQQQQEGFRPE
nr:hypothetical protein [Tanacetum cinerariifolium]